MALVEVLAAPTQLDGAHPSPCVRVAGERGWPAPSYWTVRSIVVALDPGLVTRAHDGPASYRECFEQVFRRGGRGRQRDLAGRPHPARRDDPRPAGRPARPWLTAILDDFSRAVAGYAVNLGAPSALQTALALRHAIWRKADPACPVCSS